MLHSQLTIDQGTITVELKADNGVKSVYKRKAKPSEYCIPCDKLHQNVTVEAMLDIVKRFVNQRVAALSKHDRYPSMHRMCFTKIKAYVLTAKKHSQLVKQIWHNRYELTALIPSPRSRQYTHWNTLITELLVYSQNKIQSS